MMRGSPATRYRPKSGLERFVTGAWFVVGLTLTSPGRNQLNALNASMRASSRCDVAKRNDRTTARSTTRVPIPSYAFRPELPCVPSAGCEKAAALSQLSGALLPYGSSPDTLARWYCMPVSARSAPDATVSAKPEKARKMPDSRQPDPITRAAVLANWGVSTLAVMLKMCVGELLQRPSSASSNSCTFDGGLTSDMGSM